MTDLLTCVEKYINSEKILKFTARIAVPRDEHEQDRFMKRWYEEDRYDKRPRSDRRESKPPPLRYNNYIPLNTARTNILIEICDRNIVNWLSKLRGNPNLEGRKKYYLYYHFHKDHEHDKEECITLKDETKMLIRRG